MKRTLSVWLGLGLVWLTACIQPTSPPWENPADDRDQDGVPASADCDDFDPKLGTGVCPRCGDGIHTGPGCEFCVDAVKAGAKCDQCLDALKTGENCDRCVDTLKTGAKCDVCVDPVKTGAKCDECLDAQRTGGACDQVLGLVLIPEGTFWMGCNPVKDSGCGSDERPQHKVTLSAYYMDVTETTVAQYKACVDAGVCTAPSAGSSTYPILLDHPVNDVTWTQSRAYCKWRGAAFDLPTEAQWEMAARGSCEKNGSTAGDAACAAAMRTYPWGENAPSASYAVMSGSNGIAAVGTKPAGDSPYGLHDMTGNVWEWNRDWYGAYSPDAVTDPVGPDSASARVNRGGSFYGGALYQRAGDRDSSTLSYASNYVGLRCMRSYP